MSVSFYIGQENTDKQTGKHETALYPPARLRGSRGRFRIEMRM